MSFPTIPALSRFLGNSFSQSSSQLSIAGQLARNLPTVGANARVGLDVSFGLLKLNPDPSMFGTALSGVYDPVTKQLLYNGTVTSNINTPQQIQAIAGAGKKLSLRLICCAGRCVGINIPNEKHLWRYAVYEEILPPDLDVDIKFDGPDFDFTLDDPQPPIERIKPPGRKFADDLPLIAFIASLALQAWNELSKDNRFWTGIHYGATGNMYRQEITLEDTPTQMVQSGLHKVLEENQSSAYNLYPYHQGIQDLPAFVQKPIAEQVAVKVPVTFDAYAFVHTFDYHGGTVSPIRQKHQEAAVNSPYKIEHFVAAFLGVDLGINNTVSEQYLEDLRAWEEQLAALAPSFGITILPPGFPPPDDPDVIVMNVYQFYDAYRDQLVPDLISTPPVIEYPTTPYARMFPWNKTGPAQWFSNYDVFKTQFVGLNFFNANIVVKFERVGNKYKYIFGDNTQLTIESWFNESIINSCFASHPLKDKLLELVKTYPIKPISPLYYTNPTQYVPVGTNPYPCWGVGRDPREWFRYMNAYDLSGLDLGESPLFGCKAETYHITVPFDGELEVPGDMPNGTILTYTASPLPILPTHGTSTFVHSTLIRDDITPILQDNIQFVQNLATAVGLVFPPAAIVTGLINLALSLIPLIAGLAGYPFSAGLLDAANCASYCFYKSFRAYPSKFRVNVIEMDLPAPVNNSVRVIDFPNDKQITTEMTDIIVLDFGVPPPPGYVLMIDGGLGQSTYKKTTNAPINQEVQVIRQLGQVAADAGASLFASLGLGAFLDRE